MMETNHDSQEFKSLGKRAFSWKLFVGSILVLVFVIAIWFLSNLPRHFQNDDEPQAVILDLPNIKTESPKLDPGTQPQPSPDLDPPEQLPESPTPSMKLSIKGNFPQKSI